MVDHASRLIAVYTGALGGTKKTIDYAKKKRIKVVSYSETEEICLEGKFDEIEEYELLDGGYQLIFKFRDETGEICFKINVQEEDKNPFLEDLKESIFYKIKGTIDYDKDGKTICISEVSGIKPIKE